MTNLNRSEAIDKLKASVFEMLSLKIGRCPSCCRTDSLLKWKDNKDFATMPYIFTVPAHSLLAKYYSCSNCGFRVSGGYKYVNRES